MLLIWQALIWAGVVLALGCLVIRSCNNRAKDFVDLKRNKQTLVEEERRVELLERENTARLEADTADARADQERARLVLETAEAEANAKVVEAPSTVEARIEEEEQVIAARAEGRALAAKERAIREGDGPNPGIAVLTEAYSEWHKRGGNLVKDKTFGQWLKGVDISQLLQT